MFKFCLYLAVLAVAYAQSNLSNNFMAKINVTSHFDNHYINDVGQIWEDYKDHRNRFDQQLKDGHEIEILQLFDNKTAYMVWDNKKCEHKPDDRKMEGFWDWVADAKASGPCWGSTSAAGTLYKRVDKDFDAQVCVAADNTTPYWSDFGVDKDNRRANRNITFTSYTPGVPAASNFAVPSCCN